jgi:hypothetical protein
MKPPLQTGSLTNQRWFEPLYINHALRGERLPQDGEYPVGSLRCHPGEKGFQYTAAPEAAGFHVFTGSGAFGGGLSVPLHRNRL